MEENSEAHMDTGVSSTTDDVLEVQEVTGTHRDVETVVTVEEIKEEEESPNKDKNREVSLESKPSDSTSPLKPADKSLQKEGTLKKIIIKRPMKSFQVQPLLKSPTKPEDTQKNVSKDPQTLTNKTEEPITAQAESSTDSNIKIISKKSPQKNNEQSAQIDNVLEEKLTAQKTPAKDVQPQDIEIMSKSPPKGILLKVTSVKEQPVKIIISREKPTSPQEKKETVKTILIKEPPPKVTPSQESTTKVCNPSREPPPKVTPTKESTAKVSNLATESPPNVTTAKESTTKGARQEPPKVTTESTSKVSHLAKEPPPKVTPTKESSTKVSNLVREPPPKVTPTKENTAKMSTPAKDTISKPPQSKVSDKPSTESNSDSKTQEEANSSICPMDVDKEASNDSQLETNSDTSEKEHKSISRELKSLINSAKESKIISECTQLTSKTRKSRTPFDTSNSNLNVSLEADRIQGMRRCSSNSQKSTSSEKSDKAAIKRSMRSQNPEFVHKVKNFLSSVTGKIQKEGEGFADEVEVVKLKNENEPSSLPKKKKIEEEVGGKLRTDPYCWRCHYAVESTSNDKVHDPMHCSVCPRSYHYKCLTLPERSKINLKKNWVCPECLSILQAENSETRSPAMKKISLGMLCDLLKYALERMMDLNGVEPFMQPVDRTTFPDYGKYVVHPMDLSLMKQQISDGMYGSTEAFLSDAQWILHNSIIFNTLQSKLTAAARGLVRSCRAEMGEIEACPECYAAAHARRPTWFTDVCSTPHILLWAKLKGFPYWPAKGMTMNSSGLVDVRFFGAHDRAWVPAKDCYLYSEKDPNNFRTKRQDILESMQEAEQHIRNLSRKYGKFVYPPFKTQFEPAKLNEQLKMMIPTYEGEVRSPVKDKPAYTSPASVKEKTRSMSKSFKESVADGDAADVEECDLTSQKMSESAKEGDVSINKVKPDEKKKDNSMDVDESQSKESNASRKRRRSNLEEAVITIIDNDEPPKEKRKRVEEEKEKTDGKKFEAKEIRKSREEAAIPLEQEKSKEAESTTPAKSKDAEPSPANDKGKKIKVISIAKVMKTAKPTPIKVNFFKDKAKNLDKMVSKQKSKTDKSTPNNKEKGTPLENSQKRRNSKSNKSLNISSTDNKNEKAADSASKDKSKDNSNKTNESDKTVSSQKSTPDKGSNSSSTESPRAAKERLQFDDDISLAAIAREAKANTSGLPTISSVRSLSNVATTNNNTNSNNKGAGKTAEVTVEASSDSSIFTPTSTDNVRNMKEAVNKLQKLRNETDPPAPPPQVGRVGVRAFARMTSPSAPAAPEAPARPTNNKDVEIEIKAEPMDFDDPERQVEKMHLMNAFKLRPVNPTGLREVRINKVVVTPLSRVAVTPNLAPKPVEVRPRAKKTFPQPKKPDEGRSELTSKNSMVYIPIQPPMTQAPTKRPITANGPTATLPVSRPTTSINTSNTASNNAVNTVTSPLVPVMSGASTTSTPTTNTPTVGQVPTTVHTVPMITTVNGQWTFSLQPVMSVGGVDSTPPSPMVNGLPERPGPAVVPIAAATPAILPGGAPALVTPITPIIAQPNRTNSETNSPGEPPRLQQRPLMNPLDVSTPVGSVPPPSTVGPITAKLNQNAVKMTDFFRTLLEDCIEKLDEPSTQNTVLKLQLEQISWRHQQQIEEIKHNYELTMAEMRSAFEKEKTRLVSEARRAAAVEMENAVKLAKSKQWCANCSQEAQFYCCWNTSYCDYPCQRAHWAQHYAVCTQQRADNGNSDNSNSPESRLQPPDTLPKTTAAPNLTAGKQAAGRMFTEQQSHPSQKPSIIVSMVEDNSGNQTMKCVGTFKPANPTQVSPLILNKQLVSSEEGAKKVVTSGGYLIVGASNSTNSTTIVNPPRRSNTIQFIS